ncbi:hypothetical protein MtrunA17_Chr8g0343141 [Medicago truncatula]|uniref:Uncharacterized protein n=1 Tax=Medicago truncatula TaxID=3880 RepID=A0A396GD28_MEDTR|nr:hypothetical protein MtrunA17_Chr8g0343141 [Medicago truncatula]
MSIDGSFTLHLALRRLLDRCPKLQSFPQIEALAQKAWLQSLIPLFTFVSCLI